MITRRGLLKLGGGTALAGLSLATYALGYEPRFALAVRTYRLTPPRWPSRLHLRAAVISDIHACDPWMPLSRIAKIVSETNALAPDIVFLTGDYVAGLSSFRTGTIASPEWAAVLAGLKAPLGVHAILGNHDWWDDRSAQRRGGGPTIAGDALEAVGIPVLHNEAKRIETPRGAFWLAGLEDQLALLSGYGGRQGFRGLDDLDATLKAVTTDEPIILLAHEPDIFPRVSARVSLTLSGHTHGGQVRVFGWSPMVPSRYGPRFAYGHVVEHGKHLIVSGGIGCSIAPIRFGVTPEIVLVELGEPPVA
ncbi:metallophosphoesterase [Aureimonas psammosilenae]|uniref:metallophosphoesterase n=1 Tax=Aureimonas psammosilenae TaxID=2495496 RepID=UPI001260BE8C|nr:metallophosphoesterase [Aureimonas psammosilenae]